MNWLAHALLSEADPEARLGNFLADMVKGPSRRGMSAAFLRGVARHQAIDAFTDWHPVVHRSRARVGGDFRHVTGILVDLFYDHFLAISWDAYCPVPLDTFTAGLYADMRAHPLGLPEGEGFPLEQFIDEDRLGSYRRVDGIQEALLRVSQRLSVRVGREFRLERAVPHLLADLDGFAGDFREFFPLLQDHVAALDGGP